MTKTIKETIRENKMMIAILIIIITFILTQMIFTKINPEKTNPNTIIRINLTEECNQTCQSKGLTLSTIDRAGIGYTAQETSGRCICLNTSIWLKQ